MMLKESRKYGGVYPIGDSKKRRTCSSYFR